MICFSYGFEVPPFSEPLTLAPHAKSHGWTSQNSAHQTRRPRLTDQKCWTLGHEGFGSWGFVLASVPMQDGSDQKANYSIKDKGFPMPWQVSLSGASQSQRGTKKNLGLRVQEFSGPGTLLDSCSTKATATPRWPINSITGSLSFVYNQQPLVVEEPLSHTISPPGKWTCMSTS